MKSTFAFLMALSLIAYTPFDTFAQEGRIPVHYSQVIDRAFAFSSGSPEKFSGAEYKVVLRFLPSSEIRELQIILLKEAKGLRVILHRLKEGVGPISEKYNEVVRENPNATIEEILMHAPVEKLELVADASITRLVRALSDLSIPTNLNTDLTLDGTTYELWIQTLSNDIHGTFSDGAYGEATESTPIIQWMKTVKAAVEAKVEHH